MTPRLPWLPMLLCLVALPVGSHAADRLVHDRTELAAAIGTLQAGDTLTLADGTWRDAAIVLRGRGTAARPIRLTAQTPGKVILTGRSSLRLAGEHLEVSNLVFRDGWSPIGEVVSFRTSPTEHADHSRVTGVVIDGYNQPERAQADHWIALYGHDDRFDHNQIVGKTNRGTTLVVVRDAAQGLDNRHRIDHNWFGPRPNLGANGGETIRVGTSADSRSDSHTTVEDNWFEGCDGEVEIVSNKSGGNVYRGNVFYHSRGSMVLRHGDGNLVEGNVFLGGGKPHTGGVRVINRRQTVRGNYFEGLAGDGFAAALSVMYGVPNSPINRYVPVDGAVIERNTFVDVRSVLLGAGKDAERSAAPMHSRIAHNLIVGADPLHAPGDLAGIAFDGNVQSPAASTAVPHGIEGRTLVMARAATGLQVPAEAVDAGAPRDLRPIAREATGVAWYPKRSDAAAPAAGATRAVAPGDGTLDAAVAAAAPGDRLRLATGHYAVDRVLAIDRPLSVEGPSQGEAEITTARPWLFELRAGGSLRLARVTIDGRDAPDEVGNAVVRVASEAGANHYTLVIEDSRIRHLTVNRGFDVVAAGKGTFADLVALRRVDASDVSGAVLALGAERDDFGLYGAERVEITDSQFHRVAGPVLDLYRGGNDESTFGPELAVTHSVFDHVGAAAGASLRLTGVQQLRIADNRFTDAAGMRIVRGAGSPYLELARNTFVRTPEPAFDPPGLDPSHGNSP